MTADTDPGPDPLRGLDTDQVVDAYIADGAKVARFDPPGPTSRRFIMCRRVDYADETDQAGRLLRLFNGPIGCAKTSTIFADNTFYLPMLQMRDPDDGIRRFQHTIVHKDYRKLWRGPIRTFFKVVPVAKAAWNGSKDGPARHVWKQRHPDGGLIEVVTEFAAVGDQDAEDFARGYEPTRVSLMEADLLAPDVLEWMEGRTGRYPRRKRDPAAGVDYHPLFRGVDMDCNAPEFGSWLEPYLDGDHPEFNIFVAPPAILELGRGQYTVNPEAENLQNLPPGYYATKGKQVWYIRRMLMNRRGVDPKGSPVYPEFDEFRHVAPYELEPDPRLPLIIGIDQGLHAAATIMQRTLDGRVLCIELIEPPPGTGATNFGLMINEVLNQERYDAWRASSGALTRPNDGPVAGNDKIRAFADPAGFAGGDEGSDKLEDQAWVVRLAHVTKLRIRPAGLHRDNQPVVRQDPLKQLMVARTSEGHEKFQVCPVKCKPLIISFRSGYQWSTVKQAHGSGVRTVPIIKKDEHSHRVESVEYGNLGAGGVSDFHNRARGRDARRPPSRAITSDSDPRLGRARR